MKYLIKIIVGMIVVGTFVVSSFAEYIYPDQQKKFYITAALTATTCRYTDRTQVDMGNYPLNELWSRCAKSGKGSYCYEGKQIPSEMYLFNCPSGQRQINLSITSQSSAGDREYLSVKNASKTIRKDIAIQLKDKTEKTILLGGTKTVYSVSPDSEGTISLPFFAQLIVISKKDLSSGSFTAVADVEVTYQ